MPTSQERNLVVALPGLRVEFDRRPGGPPTLLVRGEIDVLTVSRLDHALATFDAGDGDGDVVVDLAETTFVGVVGVEALCRHARRLGQAGGTLRLASPSSLTRRLIGLVDANELLGDPSTERRMITATRVG